MANKTVDVYKAAKYYLDIGWSLLPIIPETKTPAVKWLEFCERYPTWEEVKQWLDNGWHLAVVTGDISKILIVDDDRTKNGLTEWGFISPVTAKTQSGGKHYYFTYDRELHSHSNADIRVDLKAWHSYCLLPPFNSREWVTIPSLDNLSKLTPLSDDIVRLINSDTKTNEVGEKQPLMMTDFIAIPVGGRTDALHRIACSVFSKYTKEEGIQILLGINQTYQPPCTEAEFKHQVESAYNFILQDKIKKGKELIEFEPPRKLQDLIEERKAERLLEKDCPKTGLPTLDYMIKGFVPKHTYTLTGTTNVGKTSLACVFAVNVAKQGKKVLYLALEPDTGVIEYMASIVHDKKFSELDPDTDYDFGNLPIDVYTKRQVKTPQRLLELLDKSERYDLIVIDHIGYFVKTADFVQEQSNILKVLTDIATAKLTSVLIIAHMRKPPVGKADKIPTIDDISGSGAFKQDSTDVWIVYKKPLEGDETHTKFSNRGFLIVAKSKASASGPIDLMFGEKKAGIYEPGRLPPVRLPNQLTEEEHKAFEQQLLLGVNTTIDKHKQR